MKRTELIEYFGLMAEDSTRQISAVEAKIVEVEEWNPVTTDERNQKANSLIFLSRELRKANLGVQMNNFIGDLLAQNIHSFSPYLDDYIPAVAKATPEPRSELDKPMLDEREAGIVVGFLTSIERLLGVGYPHKDTFRLLITQDKVSARCGGSSLTAPTNGSVFSVLTIISDCLEKWVPGSR